MLTLMMIAALGVLAGVLTTVAGMGGGLLLVTALAVVWGPHMALPVTAAALLVGNLHRAAIYRRHLRMEFAWPLMLGIIPGSLVGAALVSDLPAVVLQGAMLGLVAFALARAAFGWTWLMPRAALTPAGGAVGVLASAGGGAAVLTCPLLLSTGIRGDEYMATMALTAATMHVSRTIGYGAGGLVDRTTFAWAGMLAITLVVGNLIGRSVRSALPDRATVVIEYGVLIVCAALSLIGGL